MRDVIIFLSGVIVGMLGLTVTMYIVVRAERRKR